MIQPEAALAGALGRYLIAGPRGPHHQGSRYVLNQTHLILQSQDKLISDGHVDECRDMCRAQIQIRRVKTPNKNRVPV